MRLDDLLALFNKDVHRLGKWKSPDGEYIIVGHRHVFPRAGITHLIPVVNGEENPELHPEEVLAFVRRLGLEQSALPN